MLNVQQVRLRFAFVKLLVLTSPICKSAVSAALLHKNSPQRTGSTPTLYFRLSPCIYSAYLQKYCQCCITPQKTVFDVYPATHNYTLPINSIGCKSLAPFLHTDTEGNAYVYRGLYSVHRNCDNSPLSFFYGFGADPQFFRTDNDNSFFGEIEL